MNNTNLRFDNSLPTFVTALKQVLDVTCLQEGQFLRNASGELAFISATTLTDTQIQQGQAAVSAAVGSYARQGCALLQPTHPGITQVQQQAYSYTDQVIVEGEKLRLNLLEQRIVGQDWLHAPVSSSPADEPIRHVFFSIKGGVGRSTALAVTAADLARNGRKVLVLDLDLEAPGLGHMLLKESDLPRFGLLDAHVESQMGILEDDFLLDMITASPFGQGRGLIDVVPAVGSCAREYPANVLAKIARAYLEGMSQNGRSISFLERTRDLVDRLAGLKTYDAVLIDARAGLNESTAAALLGLGAQVLLFGENTPQTFAGYRYLLAHLARFKRSPEDDWLDRLHMVHAKASADASEQQRFRDQAHAIFQELVYQETPLDDEAVDPIVLPEFSVDDPNAPHFAWPVLRDSNYVEFNPLAKPSELTSGLYERTYEALLTHLAFPQNVSFT